MGLLYGAVIPMGLPAVLHYGFYAHMRPWPCLMHKLLLLLVLLLLLLTKPALS
jgi:hypothetical protein